MQIFCTGAAGYIGGSVATSLASAGHDVTGLVRSEAQAGAIRALGIKPVIGSLDDAAILEAAARRADAVVNAANADHEPSVRIFLRALEGSGKVLIHTSGSSIVGMPSAGHLVGDIFDEATPLRPSPARQARAALNQLILTHATHGVRTIVMCPSLIYGQGRGLKKHSMQVPWLIDVAIRTGCAKHYGPGENVWSNVHIDDLVDLFARALVSAPAGAFYFAENGEASMREVCCAINTMLGVARPPEPMTLQEASQEWGLGVAENTMGSNSRVRAIRARSELGWTPKARSLNDEIKFGCYKVERLKALGT